jgi:hypothetical protein
MSISMLAVYKLIVPEEVRMFTQPTNQQVRWQNLKVISEVDLVLYLAKQNGWKDCKIFGSGDMLTQPVESLGWNLIPADLFEYSIPAEGVDRILQILNAGVRIQGVIVADDLHSRHSTHMPAKPLVSLPSTKTILSLIGKALVGLAVVAGTALFGLMILASAIMLAPLFILGAATDFDPQLIVLVDDGDGGIAWISVLTWFDE